MSDLLDQLESFPADPAGPGLPAAEVRRRGDRRRQLRYAATAMTTAAAVIGVAFAVGVLPLGGPPTQRLEPADRSPGPVQVTTRGLAPAPTSATEALTDLPAGFTLAAGYPETNEDGTAVRVVDGAPDAPDLAPCGTPVVPGTGAVDRISAAYVSTEDVRKRAIYLFDSLEAASVAVQQARIALARCPEESSDGDRTVYTGFDPRRRIQGAKPGDDWFGVMVRYDAGAGFDPGLVVFEAVRVGRVVLVTQEYSEGNGSSAEWPSSVSLLTEETAQLVSQLRTWAGP